MAVIGTKAEYFSAVWVRNAWARFYKLKELNDRKLMLFACNEARSPNCYKVITADPSMQAAICPQCKKPFVVADAVVMSDLLNKKRIKCPFCGREQERNRFGCIFCHKKIPV